MPINISASLISDFLICNKRAFYRINHPELGIPNKEMIIGTVVHSAIEESWKDKTRAMEIIYYQLNSLFPDDFESITYASRCLNWFFDKFRPLLKDDDKIEVKFKIPFSSDVNIVGKIDRISQECIFDWKTARYPPKNVEGNVQFILYNWAYEKMYKTPPKGVYYAALNNGNLIMYKHDKIAERILLSDVIPMIISEIKMGNFSPTGYFQKACYRCSFADTCLKELRSVLDRPTSAKK